MTGHAPFTELSNSIIIAPAGTEPVNVTNAQDTRLIMDNVQITAPAAQKVLNVVNGQIVGKRITSDGPAWENAGRAASDAETAMTVVRIACFIRTASSLHGSAARHPLDPGKP